MLISFSIIFIFGILFAKISEKLGLPKLIGMIILGIIIGVNGLNLLDDRVISMSSELRQIALIVILTRAGLSLNLGELKKIGLSAWFMAFIPAVFEMIGIVIIGRIVFGITLIESLIMGAVISAVSPAIIVPRMINILDKGYKKAPPQLVLAGASLDDIFVIVLFTTFLSIEQGSDVSIKSFLVIPISIICGIIIGVISAKVVCKVVKHLKIELKVIIIISISFILMYIEEMTKNTLPISGLIAIMTMGIMILKQDKILAQNIKGAYDKMWSISEILLFVLVGTIIDMKYIIMFGAMAIFVILFALLFRILGVYISLIPSKFNNKEKLFCAISYIPKATVQASIGAIPLTAGLECGELVFTMAMLSIIITAPLGAILIDKNYKKLLIKNKK